MAWDENKHPRDSIGRFTFKSKLEEFDWIYSSDPKIYEHNTSSVNLIGLNFFAKESKSLPQQKNIAPPPREVYGFANSERLNTDHHKRHAKEMGFKDQKQYEKAAIEFWKNGKGKVYYSPYRDRYYKYDSKKELFISVDIQGTIHTFMISDNKRFNKKIKEENLYEMPGM